MTKNLQGDCGVTYISTVKRKFAVNKILFS